MDSRRSDVIARLTKIITEIVRILSSVSHANDPRAFVQNVVQFKFVQ
jgi:hypothetical protein